MVNDLRLPFPRQTRRRQHTAALNIERGRRTAWLRGGGEKAILDAVGAPSQWDPRHRCWMTSVTRLDDVLAFVEYKQRRVVTVTTVDR